MSKTAPLITKQKTQAYLSTLQVFLDFCTKVDPKAADKEQKISKVNCVVLNSPQKWTKQFSLISAPASKSTSNQKNKSNLLH